MMAVAVTIGHTFNAGPPRLLFEGRYLFSGLGTRMYDVSPYGERFVMVKGYDEALTQINVVLNWFEELERIVLGEK